MAEKSKEEMLAETMERISKSLTKVTSQGDQVVSTRTLIEGQKSGEGMDEEMEDEEEGETAMSKPKKKKKKAATSKEVVVRERDTRYDIEGVFRLILSPACQKIVGCVPGEDLSRDDPWIYVEKELLIDNLEIHDESYEFLPIKNEIIQFPRERILLGLDPNEDELFMLCLTEASTDTVEDILTKKQQADEERLINSIYKTVKAWKPLGSEKEVIEMVPKQFRALLEVEIESKYPILPGKITFRPIRAEDMRDGYMELRQGDEQISNIIKKRIDNFAQAAPSYLSNWAQTTCTYPSNAAMQYEYDISDFHSDWEKLGKVFREYIKDNQPSLDSELVTNGYINLYSNDYENLIQKSTFRSNVKPPTISQYISFVNVEGKEKMVSCTTWHPMWTGILAVAYVDLSPKSYLYAKQTTDKTNQTVYGKHRVLIWSFVDDLKPKLILEAHREVNSLSFCPYDENLLVGGCENGQIIIWDIKNRLQKVEEQEMLSDAQQKYRVKMWSLMGWMKNVYNPAFILPTVISDLKYSQHKAVNDIKWLSPFHDVTKNGKIVEKPETKAYSLQFMTSSEDGTLAIWDLLRKQSMGAGSFKPFKKLKRLKKRPSALTIDVSPFKMLHLNLRPVYIIRIWNSATGKLMPISTFYIRLYNVDYKCPFPGDEIKAPLKERLIYEPMIAPPNELPKMEYFIGTMDGRYIHGQWEGQDFDAGEIVNYEHGNILNTGKVHDGPICNVSINTKNKLILTVGGKVFAIWREGFKDKPLFWRKSEIIYTYGSFYPFRDARFQLVREDGSQEFWVIYYKSKEPGTVNTISRGLITNVTTHPRRLKRNVAGVSDIFGVFRLFYMTKDNKKVVNAEAQALKHFVQSEIERKQDFLDWQTMKNEKYLKENKIKNVETPQVEGAPPPSSEEAKAETDKNEAKGDKDKKAHGGLTHGQWVEEENRRKEEEIMKNIMLSKKQLNTETLKRQRKPLDKLEKENEIKKSKQKKILKDANRIFTTTVAALFPDVVKEKPPQPENPYEIVYGAAECSDQHSAYNDIINECEEYINGHPYNISFSWKNTMQAGRQRRKYIDDTYLKNQHQTRFVNAHADSVRIVLPVIRNRTAEEEMEEMKENDGGAQDDAVESSVTTDSM